MVAALEPLARRTAQPSGSALLEHLLDLVGLSGTALATSLAASDLGKALVTAGQLSALKSVIEVVSKLDIPNNTLGSLDAKAIAALAEDVAFPPFPEGMLPKLDLSAIVAAANFSIPIDNEAFQKALSTSVRAWLPEVNKSLPASS